MKHTRIDGLIYYLILVLWGYLFVMPYVPYRFYAVLLYDYRRILELLLFLIVIASYLLIKSVRLTILTGYEVIPKHIRIIILLILFLGVCSSLINAYSPPVALLQVAYYWMMFMTFLFFTGVLLKRQIYTTWLFSITLAMLLCYAILITLNYLDLITFTSLYPNIRLNNINSLIVYPHFGNKRLLNQFISWILPLTTCCIFYFQQKFLLKIVAISMTIFLWYLVIASDSRAYLLEYILLFPLLFYINRKLAYKYMLISFATFIVGLLMFYLIGLSVEQDQFGSVIQRNVFVDNQRMLLLKASFQAFAEHPILGIGPLQFSQFILREGYGFVKLPHNFYIQVLAEWGIIAFTLMVYVISYGIIKITIVLRKSSDMFSFLIFAAMVCGLIHAAVSDVLFMPLSQYTAVVILAMMMSSYIKCLDKCSANNVSRMEPLILGMGSLASVAILIMCLSKISFIHKLDRPLNYNDLPADNYQQTLCPNLIYYPKFEVVDLGGKESINFQCFLKVLKPD